MTGSSSHPALRAHVTSSGKPSWIPPVSDATGTPGHLLAHEAVFTFLQNTPENLKLSFLLGSLCSLLPPTGMKLREGKDPIFFTPLLPAP